MKIQILTLFAVLFFSHLLFAQNNPAERKITVVGTATKEIIPDEIYLSISLREYQEKENKVDIETLERQLAKAVDKADIPEEDFQIENIYGWNYQYWRKERKNEEFMARKRYRLKLSDLNKVNEILASLDPKGVESMNVSDYSHSRIEEFKTELKIEALKNAQEKARKLVESMGEALGRVWEITEMNTGQSPVYPMRSARMMESSESGDLDIGFKKIELEYDITAVFEIKNE